MRRLLTLASVLLAAGALAAEPVRPQARFVAGTIPGTLRYQVVIEGAGHGEISGVLGQLTNLEVLAGPVLAQQVSWRGTQAVAVTALTWVVRARTLGPIAVGPTTVRLGDSEAVTNSVRATAVAGGHAAAEGARPELRVELSRSRLLVGEPLVVRFSVESPDEALADGWDVQASFPESWSERLPANTEPRRATTPEGIERVLLGGWLVIPVRAGQLEIPPAVARVVAAPGEAEGTALPVRTVTSEAASAEVEPLPPAPAPYFGGVGRLTFSRRLLSGGLRVGELATLEVEVEGVGNLPLLDPPPVRLPEGLRGFPAEETHEWRPSPAGLVGWRLWRIPIEATRPGGYELPEVRFCTFRPEASYDMHTLPAIRVVVAPPSAGPPAAAAPAEKPIPSGAFPRLALLAAAFVLGIACAAASLGWRARRRGVPPLSESASDPVQELRRLQLKVEGWARARFGVAVTEGGDRLADAGCARADAAEAVALVQACERLRFAPSLADPADAVANVRLRVERLVATPPHRADTLDG
jgi:hypothetical protein